MKRSTLPLLILLTTTLSACGEGAGEKNATKEVTLNFKAMVGDLEFRCGETYQLGTQNSNYQPLDSRMYVHSIKLRDKAGAWHTLSYDGVTGNQPGFVDPEKGIALLDFEDKKGLCSNGTTETNLKIVGKLPGGKAYDAVQFYVGVPEKYNHLNAQTEKSPLNLTSLYWAWKSGYKFMRVDGRTDVEQAFVFHLGATGCSGTVDTGFTCKPETQNQVLVELVDFSDTSVIVFDYKKLFQGSDLSVADAHGPKGCMSGPTDMECAPLFQNLGLPHGSLQTTSPQSVFYLKK